MSLLFWCFWLAFIAEPRMYQWIELSLSSLLSIKNKISVGKYFFAFMEPKNLNKKIQFSYMHKLNPSLQITSLIRAKLSLEKLFLYVHKFLANKSFFMKHFPALHLPFDRNLL